MTDSFGTPKEVGKNLKNFSLKHPKLYNALTQTIPILFIFLGLLMLWKKIVIEGVFTYFDGWLWTIA